MTAGDLTLFQNPSNNMHAAIRSGSRTISLPEVMLTDSTYLKLDASNDPMTGT